MRASLDFALPEQVKAGRTLPSRRSRAAHLIIVDNDLLHATF
jgi:hypothetical protein